MKRPALGGIIRRLLFYLFIAIAFLIAFALIFALMVRLGMIGNGVPRVGWFGLAAFTPIVFWNVIKPLKRHWKRVAFWSTVGALLLLHLAAFVQLLLHFPQFPLLWFIPLSMFEGALFWLILERLFDQARN